MKITILTENTAGGKLLAEHGLSCFIEIDGKNILFDTGSSDVFLKNAEKLNLDIELVETIVLSHGHWDHGNGLQFLQDKTLVTHPASFIKRFRKIDHSPIGLKLSKDEIQKKFRLKETGSPLKITDNLWFLGEIPRENDFESQTTSYVDKFENDDFVPDDSALTAIVNDELVIITGCSHSGICNITEYAKKVTGIKKVKTILGGFHLKYDDQQTRATIEYFKNINVENVFPSHCTELPALAAFYEVFKCSLLKTGTILSL